MSLLLNHYMYTDEGELMYFGDRAEDFLSTVDDVDLENLLVDMYGGSEVPPEFSDDVRQLTRSAISEVQLSDRQWTSERLPGSPMRSLRDVDAQLPIDPEWKYKDILSTYNNR
jgi:hypothetical protein